MNVKKKRMPGESEENHKKRVKLNVSNRIKSAQAKKNKDAMNAEFKEMKDQDERNKLYDTNKANVLIIYQMILDQLHKRIHDLIFLKFRNDFAYVVIYFFGCR